MEHSFWTFNSNKIRIEKTENDFKNYFSNTQDFLGSHNLTKDQLRYNSKKLNSLNEILGDIFIYASCICIRSKNIYL